MPKKIKMPHSGQTLTVNQHLEKNRNTIKAKQPLKHYVSAAVLLSKLQMLLTYSVSFLTTSYGGSFGKYLNRFKRCFSAVLIIISASGVLV